VGYVLNLAVATMVLSGLLFAAGSVVESQSRLVVEDELDVIGNRVAAGLMEADRLVQVGSDVGDPTVEVRIDVPSRVGNTRYTVDVDDAADEFVLRSADPEVTIRVSYLAETDVRVAGGAISPGEESIVVEYDPAASELVVTDG
jgi:hypothetical protein